MFPDFLCIGAQKAGTGWLFKNLKSHPEIWIPPVKEIHYFNLYQYYPYSLFRFLFFRIWRRQLVIRIKQNRFCNNLHNARWNLNFFFKPHTIRWYKSIFEPGRKRKTGDITPAYSTLSLHQVAYIHKIMPDVKIIFFMRNPIDRAWSHMRMWAKQGIFSIEDEKQIFNKIRSKSQMLRGDYLQILRNWENYYPKEQIFIGFFEEISECPEELLFRLYRFLGISSASEFIPKTIYKKSHVGMKVSMPPRIAFFLANIYYNDIVELNKLFGGYTENWLCYTKKLLNTKPNLLV